MFSLLMTRRFAPLFWTQFFSAFSDNFLKNALVFLILFHIGGSDAEALITLAAAVFIAPYFFLSALGGQLADRYDKAVVARRLKLSEIGAALVAVAGFTLHSVPVLFLALFLFGGSTLNNFAFALLIGQIVGTYSSIAIAAPLVLVYTNLRGQTVPQVAVPVRPTVSKTVSKSSRSKRA